MTQEEAKTSPFRMALNQAGRFVKRHALTFAAGVAAGVGLTLVAQNVQQEPATETAVVTTTEEVSFQ